MNSTLKDRIIVELNKYYKEIIDGNRFTPVITGFMLGTIIDCKEIVERCFAEADKK